MSTRTQVNPPATIPATSTSTHGGAGNNGKVLILDGNGKADGLDITTLKAAAKVDTVAATNVGAGASGKALVVDGAGKAAGRVLETDGAKLDGIQSGVATLVAGAATVAVKVTANTRIVVSPKNPVPGAGSLTVNYGALVADRTPGAPGSFIISALLAAGTINVLDTSDVDWIAIG